MITKTSLQHPSLLFNVRLAMRRAAYKALTDPQGRSFTAASHIGIAYQRNAFKPFTFFHGDRDITSLMLSVLRS